MDLDDLYSEGEYDEEQSGDQPTGDETSIDSEISTDTETPEETEAVYTMTGDSVTFLSDVLNSVGLSLSGITSVGEIVEDGAAEVHLSIEAVEGVDGEYALRVVKDFDRITLGIITESDIVEIVLMDGVATAADTDAEEAGEPEAASDPESEDTGLDSGDQETVEPVIENEENGNTTEIFETELKQTEVGEEQTEVGDSVLAEEAASVVVEAASTEAADEDSKDAQNEDAVDVEDATGDASADEETTGDPSAIEEAQSEDATDDTSVKDEETAEDAADGQAEEEQQAEDGSEVEDEQQDEDEQQAEDVQQDEDGSEAEDEQAGDEQTVVNRYVSLDFSAYIVEDSHTVYLYDDAMNAVLVDTAEIDRVDGVVAATVDEGEAADEEAGEPTEDAPGEEAQEVGAQAEPVEDMAGQKAGVLIITGDGEYELYGTAYAVSGLVLPGDEETVEAPSDAEEEPAEEIEPSADDEAVAEEPSEDEPAADQAPIVEQVIVGYKLEYDLSGVEAYPVSLRALMDQAEPVYEEAVIEPGVSADEEEAADNEEADATDGEDAADEDVTKEDVDAAAVTEDDAVEETVDAAPAVEGEAHEDAVEETGEAVRYDDTLLTVEQTDEDWLIAPAADFDEAEIAIGLYDIVLLNGKAPVTYPPVVFDDATDYINVHVEALEGAFPAGTTMRLEDIVDEQALADIGDAAVTGENVEVRRVHAVDITFQDVDGQEIEPLTAINVVMTLREIEQDEETVVVHMDDEGNINTVAADAAPADAAQPADEAAEAASDAAEGSGEAVQSVEEAGEAGSVAFTTDAFSIYAMVVTKKIETKYITADGETYSITLTCGPEAKIPDEATLSVSEVTGEAAEQYLEKMEETIDNTKQVTSARFFDIRIMVGDEEIQPAAPVKVQVVLEGEQAEDATPCAVHFESNDGEESEVPVVVEATEKEDAVEFHADSFSVWGVVYTVDFHWGVDGSMYTLSVPGGDVVSFRALVEALGILDNAGDDEAPAETEAEPAEDAEDDGREGQNASAADDSAAIDRFMASIENVSFSSPELVSVMPVDMNMTVGALKQKYALESEYSAELTDSEIAEINSKVLHAPDWALVSLKPFNTEEALTVTLRTGEAFTIVVTDAQISRDYVTASGDTYTVTVTYDDDAEIPDGSELVVTEILPGDEGFDSYYADALQAAGIAVPVDETEPDTEEEEIGEETEDVTAGSADYARFFDIEIQKDGVKVEPKAGVVVDIALADAPEEKNLQVVHFEADGPVVMETREAGDADVRFETESFSVWAILNTSGDPTNANNLDGRTFIISNNNEYLTTGSTRPGNLDALVKSSTKSDAAIWKFESTGNAGEYYISATVDNTTKYLHLDRQSAGWGHARIDTTPEAFTVSIVDDDKYLLRATSKGADYYLENVSYGFIGKPETTPHDANKMSLEFTQPSINTSATGNYAVIIKNPNNGKYYAVQNDGSLAEVEYDVQNNVARVNLEYPFVWTYTSAHDAIGPNGSPLYGINNKPTKEDWSIDFHPDWEPFNIRIAADATGYDTVTKLANGYYYRYISPLSKNGIYDESEDDQPNHGEIGTSDDRSAWIGLDHGAKWYNGLRYENNTLYGIRYDGTDNVNDGSEKRGRYRL